MFYGDERVLSKEEVEALKRNYIKGLGQESDFDGLCLCLTIEAQQQEIDHLNGELRKGHQMRSRILAENVKLQSEKETLNNSYINSELNLQHMTELYEQIKPDYFKSSDRILEQGECIEELLGELSNKQFEIFKLRSENVAMRKTLEKISNISNIKSFKDIQDVLLLANETLHIVSDSIKNNDSAQKDNEPNKLYPHEINILEKENRQLDEGERLATVEKEKLKRLYCKLCKEQNTRVCKDTKIGYECEYYRFVKE